MKIKIGKYEFNFGREAKQGHRPNDRRFARGKYDAAQTNHMNERHWANADNLSADQANTPGVRRTLRNRARYEISNNAYMKALVETYANEVVGTGPRMEFLDLSATVNMQVEAAWEQWFNEIGGPDMVKLAFETAVGDGEAFLVEANGDNIFSPVQLTYIALDAERCSNSITGFGVISANNIDGVLLNDIGKPIAYEFLEKHPGSSFQLTNALQTITLPKKQVIHFFKTSRPEQHRGVPEITAALPLGAKLRAFTLSTVDAARIASTFSGVLHTTSTALDDTLSSGGQTDSGFEDFDVFGLENGMFLTLPEGYDMRQVKAEHPTTTYPEFKKAIVAEMARSINMPLNVASGDSSGFNFASGRLDRLSWRKVISIRQDQIVRHMMWPMFRSWWEEAIRIEGLLPRKVTRINYIPRFKWFFDGDMAIDPQKESKANETELNSGATTFADVYAAKGKNWKAQFAQRAEEEAEMERLGLSFGDVVPTVEEETEEIEEEVV